LSDVCYSAGVARTHFRHRLAIVGTTREEIRAALTRFAVGHQAECLVTARVAGGERPKVAMVFPEPGGEWVGMGRELLEKDPVFSDALRECDAAIQREAKWSVVDELTADVATSRLNAIEVAQPTLFALGYALAALWRSNGIEPDAVVGRGIGEVTAACVAGALSVADAVAIVCRTRGDRPPGDSESDELIESLSEVRPMPGAVPIFSTLTNRVERGETLDATYWMRNLSERPRFTEAISGLLDSGHRWFVEVSPHPTAVADVQEVFRNAALRDGLAIGSLQRNRPAVAAILTNLAQLYVRGASIPWADLSAGARLVPLPTYPFQRARHWISTPA